MVPTSYIKNLQNLPKKTSGKVWKQQTVGCLHLFWQPIEMLLDVKRLPQSATYSYVFVSLVIFTLRFFFINCQKSNAKPECVMLDCFYPLLFFYGQQLGNHTKRLRCLFCSSLQYIQSVPPKWGQLRAQFSILKTTYVKK